MTDLASIDCSSYQVTDSFTYDTPGTYFAPRRVFSNREGDVNAEFRRLQNLASARIVVT